MDNYYKLLKDSRWYRKRKKIFKRDNGKCTVCGTTKNLVVHHTFYYDKDTRPWLYPNSSLITLCKTCHNDWHIHNELVIIKKPPAKQYIPISRETLKGLNYYEIEYICKKGGWGMRQLYAKDEVSALLSIKTLKEVIKIKKLKNPIC